MTVFVIKGDTPLTEQQLQKRNQAYIDRDWPQWKRERSLRKQDGEFNNYMITVESDMDTNRDNNTFNKKLSDYLIASSRLSQYVLADGRDEITEMQPKLNEYGYPMYDEETGENIMEEVVVAPAIEPLEPEVEVTREITDENGEPVIDSDGMPTYETVIVPNPEIVEDNAERAEAQVVVDGTPQEVIDFSDSV